MDHKGHVMQVGSPVEVFENPANDFVFKFLGVSNFLPVEQRGGGLMVGGQQFVPQSNPTVRAEKLVAAFRPTDVHISRGGAGLKGKIVRASFLGADMDYLVDVESRIIRTQLNTYNALHEDLILKEGDACAVDLSAITWFDETKLHTEGVS
jgi:iron(III) transport system ATP-binding protein